MKAKRTWILIADGSRAKVLESHGPVSDLVPVEDMAIAKELPANRDLQENRPGRSFESFTPMRHAMENRVEPHRQLKRELAGEIADKLERSLRAGRFDRLAIIAPPTFLGDLRSALSDQVRGKVAAELAKDLVKVPHQDLPRRLEGIWGVAPKG
jgi:protein required for attachment to host cells